MGRKSKAQNGAAQADDDLVQDNDVQEDVNPTKQVVPEQKPIVKAQTSLVDDKKEEVKAPAVERSQTSAVKKDAFESAAKSQKMQQSPVDVSRTL